LAQVEVSAKKARLMARGAGQVQVSLLAQVAVSAKKASFQPEAQNKYSSLFWHR
jgi:hypothetical protein